MRHADGQQPGDARDACPGQRRPGRARWTGRARVAGPRPRDDAGPSDQGRSRARQARAGRERRHARAPAPRCARRRRRSRSHPAAHSRGNRLMGVKPGMVLISDTNSSPSRDSRKSTRAKPLAPMARNAAPAMRRISAARSASSVRRQVAARGVRAVLGDVVVELAAGQDLARPEHLQVGGQVAEDGDLQLPGVVEVRLRQHQVVEPQRLLDGQPRAPAARRVDGRW